MRLRRDWRMAAWPLIHPRRGLIVIVHYLILVMITAVNGSERGHDSVKCWIEFSVASLQYRNWNQLFVCNQRVCEGVRVWGCECAIFWLGHCNGSELMSRHLQLRFINSIIDSIHPRMNSVIWYIWLIRVPPRVWICVPFSFYGSDHLPPRFINYIIDSIHPRINPVISCLID